MKLYTFRLVYSMFLGQKKIRWMFRTVTIFALLQLNFHFTMDEFIDWKMLHIYVSHYDMKNAQKYSLNWKRKFFRFFFLLLFYCFSFEKKISLSVMWSKYLQFLYWIFSLFDRMHFSVVTTSVFTRKKKRSLQSGKKPPSTVEWSNENLCCYYYIVNRTKKRAFY